MRQRVGCIGGSREEKALTHLALQGLNHLELIGGLDPLGDDLDAQRGSQRDDGADDLGLILALAQSAEEGAVDLDAVDGEASQIAEARVARAEVIEVDRSDDSVV